MAAFWRRPPSPARHRAPPPDWLHEPERRARAALHPGRGHRSAGTLVVCDDYALPLGAIRTRRRGSDGGHNGLASVLGAVGTTEVPRMRLGVGAPPAGEDPADYVLSRFAPNEVASVEGLLARAVEAIETAVGHGIETAMNRFNRTPA